LIRFIFVNLACARVAGPSCNARWIALALFDLWFVAEMVQQGRSASSSQSEEDFASRALLTLVRDASLLLPAWFGSPAATLDALEDMVAWGVGIFTLGFAIRLHAMRTLGRHFTMSLTYQTDHVLLTGGSYRRLRHPGYLGLLLIYSSFSLVCGSVLSCAIIAPLSLVALIYRIRLEERLLMRTFGQRYVDYRRRTWALVPRFRSAEGRR